MEGLVDPAQELWCYTHFLFFRNSKKKKKGIGQSQSHSITSLAWYRGSIRAIMSYSLPFFFFWDVNTFSGTTVLTSQKKIFHWCLISQQTTRSGHYRIQATHSSPCVQKTCGKGRSSRLYPSINLRHRQNFHFDVPFQWMHKSPGTTKSGHYCIQATQSSPCVLRTCGNGRSGRLYPAQWHWSLARTFF